jgi:hypothetical protein
MLRNSYWINWDTRHASGTSRYFRTNDRLSKAQRSLLRKDQPCQGPVDSHHGQRIALTVGEKLGP